MIILYRGPVTDKVPNEIFGETWTRHITQLIPTIAKLVHSDRPFILAMIKRVTNFAKEISDKTYHSHSTYGLISVSIVAIIVSCIV